MLRVLFGYSVIILVGALPYIVLVGLGLGLICGLVLVIRGVSGGWVALTLGTALIALCGTAALTIIAWANTCPSEGSALTGVHRLVYSHAMEMRGGAAPRDDNWSAIVPRSLLGAACRSTGQE